jgi:hypothetical protein
MLLKKDDQRPGRCVLLKGIEAITVIGVIGFLGLLARPALAVEFLLILVLAPILVGSLLIAGLIPGLFIQAMQFCRRVFVDQGAHAATGSASGLSSM